MSSLLTEHPLLAKYIDLVREANTKINLVSRKDIDQLYAHHILPSLLFLNLERLLPGDRVLDIGSGGGFPGIVLAIVEPSLQITLTDSIKKKADFLQHCVQTLQLTNVQVLHKRAEEITGQKFDHVTARAVAPVGALWGWAKPLLVAGGTLETIKGRTHAEAEVLALGDNTDYDIIPCPDFENTVIVSVVKS